MRIRIQLYVYSVSAIAATLSVLLYVRGPVATSPLLFDVAILSILAMAGEMLAFVLPRRAAMGSIGFIPFFAAAILIPSWESVLGVFAVRSVLEIAARREPIKALLNVASHTLMECVAVSLYVGLGGASLLQEVAGHSLTQVTQSNGLPALLAFAGAFLANNTIVFAAIAIATGRKVSTVWLESSRATFPVDLITTPVIFVFAWVFAAVRSNCRRRALGSNPRIASSPPNQH